jgi:hypothetical protein
MAIPPKDGATRPCGGVAPNFKCDQMATYQSKPPMGLAHREPVSSGTGLSGPEPAPQSHPGWCCPLGHFEAHEPQTTAK